MTIEGASQTADDQDADARRVEMALTALLSAPVSTSRADAGDIIATVSGHRIRVRLVGRGWPRDVEAALSKGRRRPDVVLAPSMSPGARTTAKAAGVGWMDEHGGAEFSVRSMFVSRTGGQPLGNPVTKWSPAAFATVEAILSDIPATVSAVAAATGYSVGSAAQALAFLADLGLLISRAPRGRISARFVDDPNRLLDEYASAVERRKRPRVLTVGLVGRDPVGVLASLGELWTASGIEWAATGAAAASVMAPLLTQVTTAEVFVHARSPSGLEFAARVIGLEAIEGGRLRLMAFPTSGTERLVGVSQGLKTAPWPRVFADLRHEGVRGEEAAEHLREQRLA